VSNISKTIIIYVIDVQHTIRTHSFLISSVLTRYAMQQ
jgi:hypothetical protein